MTVSFSPLATRKSMTQFNPEVIETLSPVEMMNEYGKFCRQTFAPNPFSTALVHFPHETSLSDSPIIERPIVFNEIDEHRIMALHCVIGICGESFELDLLADKRMANRSELDPDVVEELGDIAYYLCVYSIIRGIKYSTILVEGDNIFDRHANPMEGLDVVKRFVFYRNDDYAKNMDNLIKHLGYTFLDGMLMRMPERDFRNVFRTNYQKLIKRYPNLSFSPEDAARRADKVDYDDNPTVIG